jgi:hypothetical protein
MRFFLILLVAVTAACESSTAPRPYPSGTHGNSTDGSPVIAPIDPTYVPLLPGDTSFWAVKGQSLDVVLRFRSTVQGQTGDRLMEFQLSAGSLAARPDGTPIAAGDSVLITVHPDSARMQFVFGPSGLTFDAGSPAVLAMWCNHAAADLNGDGVVNGTDEQLWYEMAIWKRELSTDPWSKQSTTRSADGYRLQATVSGFSGFSVGS